ncbi:MAG: hypothetical protein CMJ19_18105 [Phycisphaeraceae bacterium]|nr:hypothetical protein [Phycisphaeraceae bacterium]
MIGIVGHIVYRVFVDRSFVLAGQFMDLIIRRNVAWQIKLWNNSNSQSIRVNTNIGQTQGLPVTDDPHRIAVLNHC